MTCYTLAPCSTRASGQAGLFGELVERALLTCCAQGDLCDDPPCDN